LQGELNVDGAEIMAILVDQLNIVSADLLVDARPVLGSGLRRLDWTANGSVLLCCFDGPGGQASKRSVQSKHKSTPKRPI
jgi:hypothetical protein